LITVYAAMLVTLGFLIAALFVVVVLPAYRRRIERFTAEALKRTLPLTEAEIRADKDRLRADYAMELHRFEAKLEDAALLAARHNVEVNRRDAKIQELTEAIADQKMSVDEHENARRVLEQAILDRLPKVEQRLAETRKLLATRDREIKTLSQTGAKQAAALDEAKQLNSQKEKELRKLRSALETRAARNREGDEKFDSSVALKTEVEALRSQVEDQNDIIERLQNLEGARRESADQADVKRLAAALAKAESELNALRATEDNADVERLALKDKIADLEAAEAASSTEILKLKAAVRAYEEANTGESELAQKADYNSLQVEVDEQRRTIAALRAEIASTQERLVRQAQNFHQEIRRAGTADAEVSASEPRKS
jgi:chromosome segregation ATPase